MLILLGIEGLVVVPSKSDTFLQSFKTVEDGAVIVAVSLAGISVGTKITMVDLELFEGLLCVHLQDDDHESAH